MHRTLLTALFLLAGSAQAWAQTTTPECPADIPSSSSARRAMAKDWFSRAEAAESAGDPIGAVKAYQCSLRLVPHAFTAFNLGRLAERTGDLELAVESFNTYLKLSPEAQDKADIEAKLAALNERIRSLRTEQLPLPPPGTPNTSDPAPGNTSSSPLPDLKPSPTPAGGPVGIDSSAEDRGPAPVITPTMWAIGGVGVAALAGGVFLNLAARSKMDKCNELATMNRDVAIQHCDAAKPRAYGSYALFGVAAAAAATDVVLFLMGRDSAPGDEPPVSVAPTAGGAVVGTHFKF